MKPHETSNDTTSTPEGQNKYNTGKTPTQPLHCPIAQPNMIGMKPITLEETHTSSTVIERLNPDRLQKDLINLQSFAEKKSLLQLVHILSPDSGNFCTHNTARTNSM